MAKVGLILDSTFDMKDEYFQEESVEKVCLTIFVDKKEHIDGTVPAKDIARAIASGKDVTTTQPSPDSFGKAIESLKAKGYKEIVILTLSSKLSGTLNSARLACEEFKDLNIETYDSKSASLGSHLVAYEALKASKECETAKEVVKQVEKLFPKNQLVLSINDLGHLVKTGRISKMQATIGNFLKIKPILTTTDVGDVVVTERIRTTKKVIDYYIKSIDNADLSYPISITHVENKEKLVEIIKGIRTNHPTANIIEYDGLSAVVAGHLGIGALGMSYIRKN